MDLFFISIDMGSTWLLVFKALWVRPEGFPGWGPSHLPYLNLLLQFQENFHDVNANVDRD